MKSDFDAKYIKKSVDLLDRYLKDAKDNLDAKDMHRKTIFPKSDVFKKVLKFFNSKGI